MQHTHHAISQAPFHTTTEQRKRAYHSSGTHTQVMARRNGSDICTMPSPYRPSQSLHNHRTQKKSYEPTSTTPRSQLPSRIPIPLSLLNQSRSPPPPPFCPTVITLSLPSIHPNPSQTQRHISCPPHFSPNQTPPPPKSQHPNRLFARQR